MGKTPALPPIGKHIQKYRKQTGLSLDDLAGKSGVSKAMLSQVETGKVNPSVAIVWRIAHGLGVSVQDLLEGSRGTARIEVFRRHQYAVLGEEDGCEIQVISPIHMAGELELYLVELKEGSSLDSSAHFPGAEEFTTVIEGKVEVSAGRHGEIIEAGDTAHYDADIDHSLRNVGSGRALMYMVLRYTRG